MIRKSLPPLPGLENRSQSFSDQFIPAVNIPPSPPTVRANVSAYTLSPGETDANPNEGAFGTKPFIGSAATSDMTLGPGSVIKVGDRLYVIADRLGPGRRDLAVKENRPAVDILMEDRPSALKFGRQSLDYQIIEKNDLGRNFDPNKEYPDAPEYNKLVRQRASVPAPKSRTAVLLTDLPGIAFEDQKPQKVWDRIGSIFDNIIRR